MEKTVVPTICPYCGVGCSLGVAVEGGRVVGLEYMPEHPVSGGALCPKGNAALEVLYHPDRLLHPMVKRNGKWQRIAWDKALDLVASSLSRIRQQYGPSALGFFASAKDTNEENYLVQKLARLLGSSNVENCARLCHAPTVVALSRALGSGAMTNTVADLANSTCFFIIGSNFAENHPVVSRWIQDAKERGASIIAADPRLTPSGWLADISLRLRPGTDVALLNGMLRVILQDGLASRDFIAQRTTGFAQVAQAVEEYTPEKTAAITGVPVASIVAAARAYARAKASAIIYGMGVTQHTVGMDNITALANLALACGQVGRSGAGLFPMRGQNNVQGACDMGALVEFLPGYIPLSDEARRKTMATAWRVADLPTSPGLTSVEMMEAALQNQLKALYVVGENPVLSHPNANHTREALSKLDFLVVQDLFMTETAELASLVLPAAAWAEREGSYTSLERRVQWSHKAIAPASEAQDDLSVICKVAQRMGLDFSYSGAEAVLREINQVVPIYAGITPERIKERLGGLLWPCSNPEHPGTSMLYTETFGTPDGLGKMTPVSYRPPAEETNADFPLLLTTGRVVLHYNTGAMTRRTPTLARRVPEAFVEINPQDAQGLGIKDGDMVTISTRRGSASARAALTGRVKPGVVFTPFHFPGINTLTIDRLDPVVKIPEFKVAACRIGGKAA